MIAVTAGCLGALCMAAVRPVWTGSDISEAEERGAERR